MGTIELIYYQYYSFFSECCRSMAPTKKTTTSGKTRSSSGPKQPTLKRVKGENFYRNAKAASRLKMLNGGKPVRDRDGKITQAAAYQKGEDETKPGRVQPDRRWFGESMGVFYRLNKNRCPCLRQYQSYLAKSSRSLPHKSCWKERRSLLCVIATQ